MCMDFVLGLVIIRCIYFPVFKFGYVISLHRLRIGGGEIQRSKGEEGQNKEDQ